MTDEESLSTPPVVMLVRSAPLNVTPAVGRYATYLRSHGFAGTLLGAELDYGFERPLVDYVDRLLSFRHDFAGARARFSALLRWQWFQFGVFRRERPHWIQFCDVFSVLPALFAKLLFGSRLIFDIRDVAKLAVSHRGRVLSWLLGAIEALGALLCDAVVVVDEPLVSALPSRARHKVHVIPNTPHADLHREVSFSEDGALRVNLAGFVSFRRNLSAFCEVRARIPGLLLDVYGTVADAETREILDRHGLGEVRRLTHAEAMARSSECDVMALMYDPSIGINRFAAPNKYYEALMLGKPVLCAEGMGLAREVEEWHCGLVVPYGDPTALETAVRLLCDRGARERLGNNARRLFLQRYAGRAEAEMGNLYRCLGVLAVPPNNRPPDSSSS